MLGSLLQRFCTKVGRRTASTGCWWSSEQSTLDRPPGSGRSSAHTDENVDTVESQLLSQEDKPQSHRTDKKNFTWGGGISQSSVSRIVHKDLHLKCYKKRRAHQLTEAHSMHALFSVCSLGDDKMITSKLHGNWNMQTLFYSRLNISAKYHQNWSI